MNPENGKDKTTDPEKVEDLAQSRITEQAEPGSEQGLTSDVNEESPADIQPENAQPEEALPKKSSRAPLLLAIIAILLTLALAAGGAYLFQQQRMLTEQLHSLAETTKKYPTQWQKAIDAVDNQANIQNLSAHINTLDQSQREADEALRQWISKVEESLQATQELAIRDQRGWQLAETEYLLRLAVQRIALVSDFDAATAAMLAADRRLHELADTRFLPVRKAIAEEISLLRGAERPDIEGTAFALSEMIKRVRTLPLQLKGQSPSHPTTSKAEDQTEPRQGRLADMLNQLVIVKRIEDDDIDESVSLEAGELLRLDLQAAQIATLRQDQESFKNYLSTAIKHLNTYYDTTQKVTRRYIEDLQRIMNAQLAANIQLGNALQVLRQVQAQYTPDDQGESE